MVYEEHIQAIDHALFERIEADSVARLPGQYFRAGERVHGHAALALLVQLGEPGPDIGQLWRQLRHRWCLGRAVQRILPSRINVIALGIAIAGY